jgi:hypothetical protein
MRLTVEGMAKIYAACQDHVFAEDVIAYTRHLGVLAKSSLRMNLAKWRMGTIAESPMDTVQTNELILNKGTDYVDT